ncbi:MlaC/ttg2D family ABC transporter substrate-binding protein [Thalassotalea ganghwensis]
MHRLVQFSLLLIALSLLPCQAVANQAPLSPYKVVEETGSRLFERIKNNQQELKKFPELMRDIVKEELMPAIDYRYAAFKILGNKHLSKTTKEQRQNFVESMKQYLVRTYASALTQYHDQQVLFEPEKSTGDKSIVAVTAKIVEANKPEIDLVFQLRKNKQTGEWKAFNLIAEGISLLDSKRAELNNRIEKYGIEQVTVELAALSK